MTYHKYSIEILSPIVETSRSFREVARILGLTPDTGAQSYIAKRIRHFKIDTSHFSSQRWRKGAISPSRKTPEEILSDNYEDRPKREYLERALRELNIAFICTNCRTGETWQGKPLSLQIHHKDGNFRNSKLDNLEILCPNCHTQKTNENRLRRNRKSGTCKDCGEKVSERSVRCRSCAMKQRPPKISWPSVEEIIEETQRTSFLATGKRLGVSDNAIRKYIIRKLNKDGHVVQLAETLPREGKS